MKNPRIVNILMSKPEKDYISLFSYGSASITSQVEIIEVLERIPIDEDVGIEEDGKILAKDEDTIKNVSYLGKNVYRIGTLDLGDSLLHSVMKLINEEYRDANVYERIDIVEKYKDETDLKSLSSDLEINIRIYHGDDMEQISDSFTETINLLKCTTLFLK